MMYFTRSKDAEGFILFVADVCEQLVDILFEIADKKGYHLTKEEILNECIRLAKGPNDIEQTLINTGKMSIKDFQASYVKYIFKEIANEKTSLY